MITRSGSQKRQLSKDVRTTERKPKLEHRHLAVIAATIKSLSSYKDRHRIALHFATKFNNERVNARFSFDRFMTACGAYDD